jgi:tRNA threonylcarbamoyladenosine biosynthesis protein TsaB
MKILSFDTSNNTCSVGIINVESIKKESSVLAYLEELRPSMQSERLLLMIERVLKIANLEYLDLDYIVSTNGPGSFTGIRVGLATLKAFSISLHSVKCRVITSFEIYKFRIDQQVTDYDFCIVILNAHQNQLYIQVFDKKQAVTEPAVIKADEFEKYIKNFTTSEIVAIAGNCIDIVYSIKYSNNVMILPRFKRIRGYDVGRAFYKQLISSKSEIENSNIMPLYIKPPDTNIPSPKKLINKEV